MAKLFNKQITLALIFSATLFNFNLLTAQQCPLCDNGRILCETYEELYGEEAKGTNILFESDNFYVAIDNHPVCKDHILIAPKKHICSYSSVSKDLEYEFDAVINMLSEITNTQDYGLFEHGSNFVGQQQKGCGNSVYHAHMHFIPHLNMEEKELFTLCFKGNEELTITLKEGFDLNSYCFHKQRGQTYLDHLKSLPTENPYLFCYFSNSTRTSLCLPDNVIQQNVPSQFFRRVFAEYFQKNEIALFWNWKNPEEIKRSRRFRTGIIAQTVAKFCDKERLASVFKKHLGPDRGTPKKNCVFCTMKEKKRILEGEKAYLIVDDTPVTPLHSLIIPKRHVASYFEATPEEIDEINKLIKIRKEQVLREDATVEGFNIGVNVGAVAGQTIFHLHVHLIPRRHGDVDNPRGGVRGVIPEKKLY